MPKETLNHLKIFTLYRIIVPIKKQSKLFRNHWLFSQVPVRLPNEADFPRRWFFFVIKGTILQILAHIIYRPNLTKQP